MRSIWPAQSDYVMALQDPASAFVDPVLRSGVVEIDPVFGLPKPRSGQMASVYKVFDGRKAWAVRCFNREAPDLAARYTAVTDFLVRNANRYTVDFEYVERGIIVDTLAYPVVKMEWIEGELLHTYVHRHLGAPTVLEGLAHAWIEMARELHAIGIAHGDLQHGNVIVTSEGELKLIDYDGMFVPAFAGKQSAEEGHPNYQHPCRQPGDFGPQLDNFSTWVIFFSIVALARDSGIWEALECGDDCLAFRARDFARPSASRAFAHLNGAADPDVKVMAVYLESLLSHEPLRLPALENCAHVLETTDRSAPSGERGWKLRRFEERPLPAGIYSEPYVRPEPYVPLTRKGPEPRPVARWRLPPAAVRVGAGVLASALGYGIFQLLGFATTQYVAVILLGWLLAAILALASSSGKRPNSKP